MFKHFLGQYISAMQRFKRQAKHESYLPYVYTLEYCDKVIGDKWAQVAIIHYSHSLTSLDIARRQLVSGGGGEPDQKLLQSSWVARAAAIKEARLPEGHQDKEHKV